MRLPNGTSWSGRVPCASLTKDARRSSAVTTAARTVGTTADATASLARYRGAVEITAGDRVVMPGMVHGHRHILSGARGAAPEGLVTLDVLRAFFCPSFEALTEEDMHAYALLPVRPVDLGARRSVSGHPAEHLAEDEPRPGPGAPEGRRRHRSRAGQP